MILAEYDQIQARDRYGANDIRPGLTGWAQVNGRDGVTVEEKARLDGWNEGGDVDDGRCNRPSGFDAHSALIAEKAAMPGATKKAVHEYLLHRCGGRRMPGYNAFTHYCRRHDIAFDGGGRPEPHPRYETPPGRQLQFDWKEDLSRSAAVTSRSAAVTSRSAASRERFR